MILVQCTEFYEQAADWLFVSNAESLPATLQTSMAESLLDDTLAKRVTMFLKEKHSRNIQFVILDAAAGKRDKELHPKIFKCWKFFQK